MLIRNIFLFLLTGILLAACSKDDLAFDIIESPVLVLFESQGDAQPGMLKIKATFYDLDKSGILDHTVGIDSIPVANLPVKIFVFENELVGEVTTDAQGSVIFEKDLTALQGAGRLEWTGSYDDIPFRVYQNY